MKLEWRNLYRGFIMGISDLIPGVSGGTLAVVLGIYDRLLEAISGVFSREWKRHIGFLLPLAAGMGSAIVLLSKVIKYVLEHYYEPTQFFFIGLIIGVIPFMLRRADVKRSFKASHYALMAAAALLLASMAFLKTSKDADPMTAMTGLTLVGLFFSGWLASMAMLMPGVSGSFVLLVLGVYATAIHALSSMDLLLIAVIGSGVVVGFIVSSKAIRYVLEQFPRPTYAIIIGLIIGSIAVVYPGFTGELVNGLICTVTFVSGLAAAMVLGSRKYTQ